MKWTVLAKIEKTKLGQRLNEKEGNGCSTNFQTIKKTNGLVGVGSETRPFVLN